MEEKDGKETENAEVDKEKDSGPEFSEDDDEPEPEQEDEGDKVIIFYCCRNIIIYISTLNR